VRGHQTGDAKHDGEHHLGQSILFQGAKKLRPDLVSSSEEEKVEEDILHHRRHLDAHLPDRHAGEQRAHYCPETERTDLDAADGKPERQGYEDRELRMPPKSVNESSHHNITSPALVVRS